MKTIPAIAVLAIFGAAVSCSSASTVISTAPIKADSVSDPVAMVISDSAKVKCPAGFKMYIRNVKPKVAPDPKTLPPGGVNYDAYFLLPDPAKLVSTSAQEYIPACFKEQ